MSKFSILGSQFSVLNSEFRILNSLRIGDSFGDCCRKIGRQSSSHQAIQRPMTSDFSSRQIGEQRAFFPAKICLERSSALLLSKRTHFGPSELSSRRLSPESRHFNPISSLFWRSLKLGSQTARDEPASLEREIITTRWSLCRPLAIVALLSGSFQAASQVSQSVFQCTLLTVHCTLSIAHLIVFAARQPRAHHSERRHSDSLPLGDPFSLLLCVCLSGSLSLLLCLFCSFAVSLFCCLSISLTRRCTIRASCKPPG